MEWIPLVPLFVAPIVAVCGVMIGCILGAVGTLLVQTKLLNNQRKWMLEDQQRQRERDLDNQRRNWKKERLTNLLTQVNRISNLVYQISVMLEAGNETEINTTVQELKDALSKIDSSFDDGLDRLFESFNNEILTAVRTNEIGTLKKLLQHIRQRINMLLANSYK
jgi:gas vesicle protein